MTGQTIRSKSYKTLISLLFAVGSAPLLGAAVGPKLPVIQQVGVIPAQWEGDDASGLETARTAFGEGFPAAVRAAHRFRVLSDDLVSGLWQDKEGRGELQSQFELHSFASLTVTPRSDTVILTARLLDPDLKSQLLETETLPRAWSAAASSDELKDKVQDLVFRLFNRMPVDVSVTSVQGQYATLSGGVEQGVQVGDEVDLVRTTIESLHPANGTWLDFKKQPLGKAQVIEVKNFTSVARLIKLTYDNAVEVGDGARIPAIAGRVKFARQAQDESMKDSGAQGPIVVPPLYLGTPPAKVVPKAAGVAAAKPSPKLAESMPPQEDGSIPVPPEAKVVDAPPAEAGEPIAEEKKEEPKPEEKNEGGGLWDSFSSGVGNAVGDVIANPVDELRLYAGPQWWSIKGPVNATGKFPLWLINSIGGGVERHSFAKFKVAFGGGGGFGKANKGTWLGYDAYAMLFWQDYLANPAAILSSWKAGGLGRFSGMSVEGKGQKYGGGDWIRGGLFGGLGGRIDAGGVHRYDWFADYTLYPLNIGRVGYATTGKGTRYLIESSLGWSLAVGAWQYDPTATLTFGGQIEIMDERMTLKNKNNRRPHLGFNSIKVMAKYPL